MKIRDEQFELNPYEECPCGSEKKFKFCCFEKARSARKKAKPDSHNYTDGRLKNMLMNFWEDTDFRHCFIDDDQCKGKIKSAHSIQNNRILNRISEDGHVYTIEATINNFQIEPEFKKISRNKASTFFGFCDYHDTEVFKPIELIPYQNTPEQNFLLAYRGFCVAYHKVIRKMNTVRNSAKQFPKSLLNPVTVNMYRVAQLDMKDDKIEFNNFTNDLRNKNYSSLETFSYTLNHEVNFAVSSCFAISEDLNSNLIQDIHDLNEDILIPRVFVNIFPSEGETLIILSYYKIFEETYGSLFKQLRNSTEPVLLNYLSYIIFNGTEDIYYRPSSIESLDSITKRSMIESYTSFSNPFNELDLLFRDLHFKFNLFEL